MSFAFFLLPFSLYSRRVCTCRDQQLALPVLGQAEKQVKRGLDQPGRVATSSTFASMTEQTKLYSSSSSSPACCRASSPRISCRCRCRCRARHTRCSTAAAFDIMPSRMRLCVSSCRPNAVICGSVTSVCHLMHTSSSSPLSTSPPLTIPIPIILFRCAVSLFRCAAVSRSPQ